MVVLFFGQEFFRVKYVFALSWSLKYLQLAPAGVSSHASVGIFVAGFSIRSAVEDYSIIAKVKH